MSDPAEIVGLEPDPLHAVAYLSTPTVPFSDRDLSDLLLASRHWNAANGLTGKLVVLEDDSGIVRFAQWIEGPRAALDACMARIAADPRHRDIEIRREGPAASRRFPGWDMGIEPVPEATFEDASTDLAGSPR
ncbi:BLUF domain-containing protein [Rubrivirga sp. IMCC45206]|uniref:BLUF domain-containing protein n=1 Tax=Rubrivirga sp. IMCC45206 TaxID=3391614 RepID=UPI00398FA312